MLEWLFNENEEEQTKKGEREAAATQRTAIQVCKFLSNELKILRGSHRRICSLSFFFLSVSLFLCRASKFSNFRINIEFLILIFMKGGFPFENSHFEK